MKTREHERLSYLDLARQKSRLTRQLSESELPRFSQLVDARGKAEVVVTFFFGDDGYTQVSGYAEVEADMVCHRCSETLTRTMRVQVSACLVADEQLATEIGTDKEVLVTDGASITLSEIVEDELILGLPERLCESDPCELTPEFSYPDNGDEQDAEQGNKVNPFSVLADLKSQNRE